MQSVLGGSLHKIYSWDGLVRTVSCFSEQDIHCFNANNSQNELYYGNCANSEYHSNAAG